MQHDRTTADRPVLAVMRPRLPEADAVLPYLRRIDAARLYSNFGPLVQDLESRLAALWRLPPQGVVTLANATLGLSACLMAAGARRGGLCLMPSWTFAASGHAARAAGLEPFLADVDAHSGALTPDIAQAALDAAPAPVSAVMVVQPFGRALDPAPWQDFHRRTGLPVVIDAAAAFDTAPAGPLPTVVSLHATKVLGAGEGGFVLCGDSELALNIRRAVNFGFYATRESLIPALNAKMSEYQAAVALAALDTWDGTRGEFLRVLRTLRDALSGLEGVEWPAGLGQDYATSTVCVRTATPAATLAARLEERGIETRRWWLDGLAGHAAFAHCPRRPLPVTGRLVEQTLGLPCWRGMEAADCARIARALADALPR